MALIYVLFCIFITKLIGLIYFLSAFPFEFITLEFLYLSYALLLDAAAFKFILKQNF
jgi:hypothetical protein